MSALDSARADMDSKRDRGVEHEKLADDVERLAENVEYSKKKSPTVIVHVYRDLLTAKMKGLSESVRTDQSHPERDMKHY